jgi:hypothetical protein
VSGDWFHWVVCALSTKKPKVDDKLKLLTDFGETEAICAEVLDDPATEDGVLLKVMRVDRSQKVSTAGSSIARADLGFPQGPRARLKCATRSRASCTLPRGARE